VPAILSKIVDQILNPIVALLFAAAFLVFLWGMLQYVVKPDDTDKTQGKKHMLWGIVGMFIMFSAWGIVELIQNTIASFR